MIYTVTLNPALDRELTVPAFDFDKVLRASANRLDWGGKGFNVSRALAALGTESIAVGFVGGATGETLAAGMAKLGIQTDFVRVAEETRSNTSIVSEDHLHYLKVNEAGPKVSATEQTALLEKIRALVQPNDWWVLAGSLPIGVPSSFYADVIKIVQSVGAHAVLDTDGEALRLGCAARPYMVKPNASEAGRLIETQIASAEHARQTIGKIHDLGAQRVVISLGQAGAVYSDEHAVWRAEAPVVEERNPIGAGDALVAGLVWGLSNGLPSADVIRWGVACGTASASLDGTAVGERSFVASLADLVRVSLIQS
jgi:1-phosphofructokinase family hexose kinase